MPVSIAYYVYSFCLHIHISEKYYLKDIVYICTSILYSISLKIASYVCLPACDVLSE